MFIFEKDKGKLMLISEKIGSDMSQSKRESFLKNQYKYLLFIFTAGEDGQVKVWSRSGMLRSTLISLGMYNDMGWISLRVVCCFKILWDILSERGLAS